jgi:inorganic pyrophosphatase
MEVKPIGVFHMADDKGQDEKVMWYLINMEFIK